MELSDEANTLNAGQNGSYGSRSAYNPVFIEEFYVEIACEYSSRKSLVKINYVATLCYNRIVPNLAALVSHRFGVPQPVAQSNVRTLAAQVSGKHYSRTSDIPMHGTGQGSCTSLMMIWCFLFSISFDSYDRKAIGTEEATATT